MNKNHRFIATVFLLIFFPSLLPINIVYASNSGPTAPEATSFEPVDAADMVNLVTGDMTYVLPLLNVPSPEGGYPLALSYHAGIANEQEASWVGLGWSLNPGALNRGISGIPDDWKRATINQIVHDPGGIDRSYFGSLSVGWGEGRYSVGLFASYSEHKAFGGQNSYGFDSGLSGDLGMMNASIGTTGMSAEVSNFINASSSFKDGSSSVGINVAGVDFSLSTSSNFQASAGGHNVSFFGNQNAPASVNVSNRNYSVTIPIKGVNIGLGFRKTKYWTYEKEYTRYNGSLYAGDMNNFNNQSVFPEKNAFDSYEALYRHDATEQLKQDNFTFVSYDSYSVSGQGISGTIEPMINQQGTLINRSTSSGGFKTGTYNHFTKTVENSNLHFYFDNENSSYLRQTSGSWNTSYNPSSFSSIYDMNPTNQLSHTSLIVDGETNSGWQSVSNRKKTGTYIETYTNGKLLSSPSLIIPPNNFNRAAAPVNGIGAFKITTMDGKTYHYNLPVYQKEKFSRTTDKDKDIESQYYEEQQLEPYATHWLLTAITGPDYVDNGNNLLDEGDFGYWVEFDYGKWSDGFVWKTPKDLNSVKTTEKSKSYEWGVKEIYYLDKIKTRTHTALFIKEIRLDDLSAEINITDGNDGHRWYNDDVARDFTRGSDGEYYFTGVYENYKLPYPDPPNYFMMSDYGTFAKASVQRSLKLNRVLLLKNTDANISKYNSSVNPYVSIGKISLMQHHTLYNTLGQQITQETIESHNAEWNGEFINNVYDVNDIAGFNLEAKAHKVIKFNTDYSLATNSPNSLHSSKGRLCLDELVFLGQSGVQVIPSYKFNYKKNIDYSLESEDNWGFHKEDPTAWSLNKIITPTGGQINFIYEEDDVDKESVPSNRVFDSGLEFKFSQSGSNLLMEIKKEYVNDDEINFTDFFQVGSPVKTDLWVCYRRDYDDWGCQSRKFIIDINNSSSATTVLSVTPTNLVLQAPISYTNDDGGSGEFFGHTMALNYNDGAWIREDLTRGLCGNPPGCVNTSPRLVLKYSLFGNRISLPSSQKDGGGLRVKEINVVGDNNEKYVSRYYYNLPGYGENKTDQNYKSSGVTSYIPQKYFKEVKYITELPPPMVMYEYVTVKSLSSSGQVNVSNQYNFEVLPDIDINAETVNLGSGPGTIFSLYKLQGNQDSNVSIGGENFTLNFSKYEAYDYTSKLGRIKNKKTINNYGQILAETQYNYKPSMVFETIGVSQETFRAYKKVNNEGAIRYRLNVSSKFKGPSVLESITQRSGGITNTLYFAKYDFLTGQVLEKSFVSGDGTKYRTKTVPAYKKYSAMGSKTSLLTNKNMLTQNAAEYSYVWDSSSQQYKEIGVGLTTWNNQWTYKMIGGEDENSPPAQGIWRKHKTYIWNGTVNSNGIYQNYDSETDDNFNWSVGATTQTNQWLKTSEVTLYNHFSNPLETKDINGNIITTKLGDKDSKVMTMGDGGYNEIFYAGAENITYDYYLEPEVRLESGSRNSAISHTGKYSVAATSNTQLGVYMRPGQHRAGRYKLSVWVHKNNASKARVRLWDNTNTYDFNGESITAGDWILKTHYFDNVPTVDFYPFVNSIDGSTVYFDDLRLQPVSSSQTSYVYDSWDRVTHIIGENGLSTRYEYDEAGRLRKVYIEVADDPANVIIGGFKLQTENTYYNKNL